MTAPFRHLLSAAALAVVCLAGLLLAACTPSPVPATAPTPTHARSQYAGSKSPPESKYTLPVIGNDELNVKSFQASAAGITLTVHAVVLLGEKATVYFSTAGAAGGPLADASGPRPPVALPESAHLGARGKTAGTDSSQAAEIVELARLDDVVLAAATFALPKTSPSDMVLDVPAMKLLRDSQQSGLLPGLWSVPVLKTRHPELPDRNHYSVYPLGPETVTYGTVAVSRGDGQGRDVWRTGYLANAEHEILDRGDLAAFRLQSGAQTMPVYAVRHLGGHVERISVETYQQWVEPTLPGWQEKQQPTPAGTPHPVPPTLSPDQERVMQATREWLDKQPPQSLQDIIKQFPAEEQTPVPALNPPTRAPTP